MRLAFSTNAYTRFPLSDALAGIRRAGFEAVEILADVPHAYPASITDDLTRDVRRHLDRLGLSVSNVNANCSFGYWKDAPGEPYFEPSLISPDPRHRADRTALILKTLDAAKSFGAANVSITSGRLLGGMPPERAGRQCAESMKPILDRAESLGIDVGIELEPGLYLEWVEELVDWIVRLGSKRFGANLDIGHSVVMGESVTDAVTKLAGRTWNLHVEDLPGRKHYHLVPGTGTFPWDELKSALQRTGYDRYLTVELYTMTADPQSAAQQSYRFLSNLFAK